MRMIRLRAGAIPRLGAVTMLVVLAAVQSSVHALAAEERRFCLTIRSEEPIDGNVLDAVARGKAILTVEEPSASSSMPT